MFIDLVSLMKISKHVQFCTSSEGSDDFETKLDAHLHFHVRFILFIVVGFARRRQAIIQQTILQICAISIDTKVTQLCMHV